MGKRWNGCGSHGVYCIPSTLFPPLMALSKSLLLQRMNVLELLPLKAVGFPLYLRAKAKGTPLWRRARLNLQVPVPLLGCWAGWWWHLDRDICLLGPGLAPPIYLMLTTKQLSPDKDFHLLPVTGDPLEVCLGQIPIQLPNSIWTIWTSRV